MRQAGRYLPSYKRMKGDMSLIEVAKNPELSSEIAVDAVRQLGVDAAILFADIMLPLEGMAVKFRIEENVGPIIDHPIRSLDDVNGLQTLDPERDVGYVYDSIDRTISKLDDAVPLIGFAGAPFTLAGYMIEGAPSRELDRAKLVMYTQPETWRMLMEKLTKSVKDYLGRQVKHGVKAIQLFDSWVGSLSREDYERYVMKYTREIFDSLGSGISKIHFCANSGSLIESFQKTAPDVLSVDWRVGIDEAWRRTYDTLAIQGNLDPVAAVAGGDEMATRVREVLAGASGHVGHIFSLGHGVLRATPPENLRRIVEMVHSETRRKSR
jgi:uroporphyrinogen decarboxylase